MADSGKTAQSTASTIIIHCPSCKTRMEWQQNRRAWYCPATSCKNHLTLTAVFSDPDAALLLEVGVPLEKLHLRAHIVALTRKKLDEEKEDGPFYVQLPFQLPESYVARAVTEMDFDAEAELRRIIGEKPWAKRKAA